MDFIINNYNFITTSISVLVNSFFTYLVLFKSRKSIGGYREVLAATGIFEIFYSLLIIVSNQLLFITPDVFIVYMKPGAIFESTSISIHIMAIKVSCIGLTYGILEVHFIYRYIAICRPHLMNTLDTKSSKMYLFIYIFVHGLIVFFIYSTVLKCDNNTRIDFEDVFFEKTGLSIYDRAMICMTVTKGTTFVRTLGYISEITLYAISLYSTMVYIVLGIFKEFKQTKMSPTTLKVQKRLMLSLVVQTIIPVVSNLIPTILSWSWPLFQLPSSIFAWRFIQFAVALFPILDPIAVILILPDYRKAASNMLRCEFRIENRSALEVMSRSRQQSTK